MDGLEKIVFQKSIWNKDTWHSECKLTLFKG